MKINKWGKVKKGSIGKVVVDAGVVDVDRED